MTKLADEIRELIDALIPEIDDDYRVDGQEDETPTMQLTVGANERQPGESWVWNYQTGDSSFTGGAYGFPHWGVGYLTRDCNPAEVAEQIADEILESIAVSV